MDGSISRRDIGTTVSGIPWKQIDIFLCLFGLSGPRILHHHLLWDVGPGPPDRGFQETGDLGYEFRITWLFGPNFKRIVIDIKDTTWMIGRLSKST